jgi:hypothetical protein
VPLLLQAVPMCVFIPPPDHVNYSIFQFEIKLINGGYLLTTHTLIAGR